MSYISHPRLPAQAGTPSHPGAYSSFDRLVSAGIGGAMLGASLAGPAGAVVGGLVGLAFAETANRAEREKARGGRGTPR